jgi:hypothetical protein
MADITPKKIKEILKRLKSNKFYEHGILNSSVEKYQAPMVQCTT